MRKEISYEFKVRERGILVGGIVDLLKVSTLPLNPLVLFQRAYTQQLKGV